MENNTIRMKYVDVEGTPTRCVLAGADDAPAVVLLHGLALTAEVWLRNIEVLPQSFRVIAPDMLGHGFTKPVDGARVHITDKIRHIVSLVDNLGVQSFSVCGSSYGALVASSIYLSNKDRVSRLLICGSGSCFNTESQLVDQVGRMRLVYDPSQLGDSSRDAWRARIGNNFFDLSKVPDELPLVAQLCYAQSWAGQRLVESMAALQDVEAFRPHRILERLEEIDCPALIVWGRDDRGGSLYSAEEAVGRMPNCRLVVLDECGHYPMLEHPDEFNRIAMEFLAR